MSTSSSNTACPNTSNTSHWFASARLAKGYVDAAQLGQALAVLREYLADPAAFEPSPQA
jgi:hypothetical protein